MLIRSFGSTVSVIEVSLVIIGLNFFLEDGLFDKLSLNHFSRFLLRITLL